MLSAACDFHQVSLKLTVDDISDGARWGCWNTVLRRTESTGSLAASMNLLPPFGRVLRCCACVSTHDAIACEIPYSDVPGLIGVHAAGVSSPKR